MLFAVCPAGVVVLRSLRLNEPEQYGFHLGGAYLCEKKPRFGFSWKIDIQMKYKYLFCSSARVFGFRTATRHETRRQDTFIGRT